MDGKVDDGDIVYVDNPVLPYERYLRIDPIYACVSILIKF